MKTYIANDSGIATPTEVLVKQVVLAQPEGIAKISIRAECGRIQKIPTRRQSVGQHAKVLHLARYQGHAA